MRTAASARPNRSSRSTTPIRSRRSGGWPRSPSTITSPTTAFVRLVSIENIHRGEFIRQLRELPELSRPATSLLDDILRDGRAAGVFRSDVDALDVHLVISSYCVFQVANRYTFGYLFDVDLTDISQRAHLRRMIGDVIVGWLTAPV